MLKQVLVSFCSFAGLLVFNNYRKEAFEITGLESGCNEGKKGCHEYSLGGRSILKSLGTADLLEKRTVSPASL